MCIDSTNFQGFRILNNTYGKSAYVRLPYQVKTHSIELCRVASKHRSTAIRQFEADMSSFPISQIGNAAHLIPEYGKTINNN
jgi:hypothetical protein